MKAIRFNLTIPRYALGLALNRISPSLLWSGISCTSLQDIPPPQLPAADWARVRTRYGGICGSDMGTIHLKTSPYYSPFSSFPFTIGHENVGIVDEIGPAAEGVQPGQRVVVEPTLWCKPRGFEQPCRYCARGEINRCERFTKGDIGPCLMVGNCHHTGGSWSEQFTAHTSQLYPVPDEISDENALMIEPFAVGLHAALQNFPDDSQTVLIVGAGTIGLCTLAALRALGSKANLIVLARYPFQAEAARRLGASEIIPAARDGNVFQEFSQRLQVSVHRPIVGKPVVVGGVDMTFECVGSDSSIDDSLRLTRAGGRIVLVGVPGIAKGIDWTPIFLNELDVRGAYIYHHAEEYGGQKWKTFDLAIELMHRGDVDLSWMVTHRFSINQFDQALRLQSNLAKHQAIKTVFAFPQS